MRRIAIVLAVTASALGAPAAASAGSQVVAVPGEEAVIGPVVAGGALVYGTGDYRHGFEVHVVGPDGRSRPLVTLPAQHSPLGLDDLTLTGTPGGLVGLERDIAVCSGDCQGAGGTLPASVAVARLDGSVTPLGGCGFAAACRRCVLTGGDRALALTDDVFAVADTCTHVVTVRRPSAPTAPPVLLTARDHILAAGRFLLSTAQPSNAVFVLDTATGRDAAVPGANRPDSSAPQILDDGTVLVLRRVEGPSVVGWFALAPDGGERRLSLATNGPSATAGGRFVFGETPPPGTTPDGFLRVTDIAGAPVAHSTLIRFSIAPTARVAFDGQRLAWQTQGCASPPTLVLWDLADPAPPAVDLSCERPGLIRPALTVDRSGSAVVPMRCPPTAPAGCRAGLWLHARGIPGNFGGVTLRSGATGNGEVGLGETFRPLLHRHGSFHATLRVSLDPGPGQGEARRTYRVRVVGPG